MVDQHISAHRQNQPSCSCEKEAPADTLTSKPKTVMLEHKFKTQLFIRKQRENEGAAQG
jgi:hypothetical protein